MEELERDLPIDIEPPEPTDEVPRPEGSAPVPLRKVLLYLLGAALIIGIERVSMLMFVMRDPDPTLLVIAGATFLTCVTVVFVVGVTLFGRARRS